MTPDQHTWANFLLAWAILLAAAANVLVFVGRI